MASNPDSVQVGRVEPTAAALTIAFGVGAASMAGPLSTSPAPWLIAAVAALLIGARRLALALPIILFCLAGWRTAAVGLDAETARAGLVGRTDFHGTVVGSIAPTERGIRFSLQLSRGRVRVHARDMDAKAIADGDIVSLRGRVASADRFLTRGVSSGERSLLATEEIALVFSRASDIKLVSEGGFGVHRTASRVRARATRMIEERPASSQRAQNGRALVRALVTGDRSTVSPELSDALRRAGIAHLLAVSGLHLAVVGLFAFFGCRRLVAAITPVATRVSPTVVAAVVAISLALLYALMTGARPSALRAFAVVFLMLGGKLLHRNARAIDSIGAAAVVLLGWRPYLLFDAGFQMSFGAAVVLVLVARRRPRASGMVTRVVSAAIGLAVVSAWALVATAPTTLAIFGELSIAGVVVNVIAVPLVELVVLPLSLIATMVSFVSPTAGAPLFDLAFAIAGQLANLALLVAEWVPTVRVPPPTSGQCLLLASAVACLVAAMRARRGSPLLLAGWRWVVLTSAIAATFVASQQAARETPRGLRVTFVDVGQGDATVIEFPNGQTWLVDAGGDPGALRRTGQRESRLRAASSPGRQSVLPFLRSQRIRALDVVVISHAHPDHFLGLDALIGEIPIGRIWLTNEDADQPWSADLHRIVSRAFRLGVIIEPPPKSVQVGESKAEFLAPTFIGKLAVDPVSSVNDNSLALIVRYRNRSLLLAGDLEAEGEALLVQRRSADLDVDVVKVNHHGSPTSSRPRWVAATSPLLAVVSCGPGNRFGFPSRSVLARWQSIGAVIARTDRDGSITVTLNSSIEFETHSGQRRTVSPREPRTRP